MKTVILQSLLLTLLVTLSACSSDSGSPVVTKDTQQMNNPRSWHVELTVSGGFAGIHRQLVIDNTGSVSVSERKSGRHEGNLSTEQLAELNKMLEALPKSAMQKESRIKPGRCADCIQSRLNIDIDGKHYGATRRSGETTTQPYADLFAYLSALLKTTLSSQ